MRRLKKQAATSTTPEVTAPTVKEVVELFGKLSPHDRWQAQLKMRAFVVLRQLPKTIPADAEPSAAIESSAGSTELKLVHSKQGLPTYTDFLIRSMQRDAAKRKAKR